MASGSVGPEDHVTFLQHKNECDKKVDVIQPLVPGSSNSWKKHHALFLISLE